MKGPGSLSTHALWLRKGLQLRQLLVQRNNMCYMSVLCGNFWSRPALSVAHIPRGALAFNGDISLWSVGNVKWMNEMFLNAKAGMILVRSQSMMSHKVLSPELWMLLL